MEHTLVRKFEICDLRRHAIVSRTPLRHLHVVRERLRRRDRLVSSPSLACEGVETLFPPSSRIEVSLKLVPDTLRRRMASIEFIMLARNKRQLSFLVPERNLEFSLKLHREVEVASTAVE